MAIDSEALRHAWSAAARVAGSVSSRGSQLAATTVQGVAVFNAPFSNTRSVVELALAEMICLTRGVTAKNHALHSGVWDKSAKGSHEMRGRTLGIIGYGNIGSQLSVLAEALGMQVVFFDTADRLARGNAHSMASAAELLEVADIVNTARGRAGRQRGTVRVGAVRGHAARLSLPQPLTGLRR